MFKLNLNGYITDKKQGLAINPARWTDIQHDRRAQAGMLLHTAESNAADKMSDAEFEAQDGKDLGRELYADLYEGDPIGSTKPEAWATSAMDIAKSLPEYDMMKAYTTGDGDFAAIGASELLEAIADQVVEMRQAYQQHQEEQQENGQDQQGQQGGQEGQQGGQQGQGDQGQGESGEGQEGGQDSPADGQGEADEAEGNGQGGSGGGSVDPNGIREDEDSAEGEGEGEAEGTQEWQPSAEQVEKMRSAMRSAMKKSMEDIDDLAEGLAGAGMGNPQSEQEEIDRTEMIRTLQRNERFRTLLKKAGRIADMPSARPAKTDDAGWDACGVKESGDIASVIGSELALLATDDTEMFFYQKLAEQKLLTVKRKGKKPLGRGPVILLKDESGSMHGDRHDMASALAMATVLNMTKDNRSTTVIGYNGGLRNTYSFTKHKTAKHNNRDAQWKNAMEHLACVDCGGGTDFDPALKAGLRVLKNQARADMIFLTDGDAGVSRSVLSKLEKAKANGLRITTILIGGGRSTAVEAISDTIISVTELTEKGAAKAIGAARKR